MDLNTCCFQCTYVNSSENQQLKPCFDIRCAANSLMYCNSCFDAELDLCLNHVNECYGAFDFGVELLLKCHMCDSFEEECLCCFETLEEDEQITNSNGEPSSLVCV